jgi:DNA-binding response OmpR family regulator
MAALAHGPTRQQENWTSRSALSRPCCLGTTSQDYEATIIMLSARDTMNERIEGLSAGADDYVTKPFAIEELLACIHSAVSLAR